MHSDRMPRSTRSLTDREERSPPCLLDLEGTLNLGDRGTLDRKIAIASNGCKDIAGLQPDLEANVELYWYFSWI